MLVPGLFARPWVLLDLNITVRQNANLVVKGQAVY